MKFNRLLLHRHRKILDDRVRKWIGISIPIFGGGGTIWSVRNVIGMTTRQLGRRLKISHSAVVQLQNSEAAGTITIAALKRVARAMNCELVYAIVPKRSYDAVVTDQAEVVAKKLKQPARAIKARMDRRLWD